MTVWRRWLPWRDRHNKARMTRRRKVALTAGALLVLAGCGYGVDRVANHIENDRVAQAAFDRATSATCMNQGSTYVMWEGVGSARECVGITDGSFPFVQHNPAMALVLKKIKAEDKWVKQLAAAGARYVSIAYLLPISATGGVEPVSTAIEQLEGAYTAQLYANHNNVQGGTRPLVQLLVASSGTQADQWRHTDQFIENDVHSQNLVAVAGVGVSLTSTIDEVRQLAGDDIPVFGAGISSDAFDDITNMVRVVPSNSEDVSAVLKFIQGAKSAILIEDMNTEDSYSQTLSKEFFDGFNGNGRAIQGPLTYTTFGEVSPTDAVGQNVNQSIGSMMSEICGSPTNLVLFAGRGRELAQLLTDLDTRICQTKYIEIVTGDDITDMPPVTMSKNVSNGLTNVTVYFSGDASPAEWQNGSGDTFNAGKAGFDQFQQTFTPQFPEASLADGNAMIGYDAMYTSINATRLVGATNLSPEAVATKLSLLQGEDQVLGATGPINLSADYLHNKMASNPVNKVIPILQWTPSGIKFVKMEYPLFAG
jgi:hypothetical protein